MSEIGNQTGILYVDETSWMVFAYVLAGAFIIYIAWCSTHVRHDTRANLYRQRTVFIFNPQTGDFQQQHSIGVTLNDLNAAHWHAPPPTLESILDEVNGITSGATYHIQRQDDSFDADLVDDDAQEIIRDMDREPSESDAPVNGDGRWSRLVDGVRHRRPNSVMRGERGDETSTPTTSTAAQQQMGRSSIVDDEPHIYPVIDDVPTATAAANDNNDDRIDGTRIELRERTAPIASGSDTIETVFGDELTIKLKYLNDDLKIVKARPNEPIGDFKK